MPVTAFLPCRAGSQRVPQKNTRPFADRPDGLLGIKLDQLLACHALDLILLSTNDPAVEAIAEPYVARSRGRLSIDRRPDHLCSASTSTDEIIAYVPEVIPEGDVVWTHVTSPFFGAVDYAEAIAAYRAARAAGTHDSLMGVTALRTFIWNETGPVNYDRTVEKWPRTQTLPPLYEVNSAIFIADAGTYRARGDRIGERPLLHAIPKDRTVDVDWEEDFAIAAELWRLRTGRA
ncbi:cytidylyltransferase domain-containing protein [Roseomonas chloroacetimidivorans]|jgi:CMP-N-acetylneuraminic acid synthetase|uniref:acylneuraminate cytidylyltransferase family protein n=1 Tax=Roseomonas chloroacetimidivorans TaxID=1766656 RepID=UPI003C73523C